MFHWYGFFIGVAMVVGYSIAEKIEPKVSKVAPWVLVMGFIGARAWHVVDLWEYYFQNLWQILVLWNGGLSIWGGLLGGGVGLGIYHYTIKPLDHLWEMLGAIVTAMPLAQAIGRLGNAVNGEFIQPVWILPWWGAEAILDLILFFILWWGPSLRGSSSQVKVGTYLVGYGLIRLVLQPYRL